MVNKNLYFTNFKCVIKLDDFYGRFNKATGRNNTEICSNVHFRLEFHLFFSLIRFAFCKNYKQEIIIKNLRSCNTTCFPKRRRNGYLKRLSCYFDFQLSKLRSYFFLQTTEELNGLTLNSKIIWNNYRRKAFFSLSSHIGIAI